MRIFGSSPHKLSHPSSIEEAKSIPSVAHTAPTNGTRDEESDALLSHLFHDYVLSGKVEGSLEKLKDSGAFERDGEENVFARASKSIVDTLAKHWTASRGTEVVTNAVVTNQLADKLQKHKQFLQFLASTKCHEELSSGHCHSIQIIMEHGEKLAVMIQLRELQNQISQSRFTGENFPRASSNINISSPIWDLIQLTGERTRQSTILLMERDKAEVFYSRVSEVDELYHCLEDHLESIVNSGHPVNIHIQRICELTNVAVTLILTAINYRKEHQVWYPSQEGLIPWYCKPVVRNGLWCIASLILKILNGAPGLDASVKYELFSLLESLAEVFLDVYYGAIESQNCKSFLDEYWSRRDELLNNLYQLAKGLAETKSQNYPDDTEKPEKAFEKLATRLLCIAKRHESYQILWSFCCDTNDSGLLRQFMHESAGPKGGFSCFVFEQLYGIKQFPELLRLGEEFPVELLTFLKRHPDLLWLHELFLQKFSSASETLHTLALSQNVSSISETDEQKGLDFGASELSLNKRRHLLNLSKIASMAGGNSFSKAKTKRIDADLKILQLQEDILAVIPKEEKQKLNFSLLLPKDLVELCLSIDNSELALRVFDVFAYTSSSFRKRNVSLLEECWKNVLNQDNWVKSHETCEVEGWSDEHTFRFLRTTMLFQAARRCYGPESETYEGRFEDVLPLRQCSVDESVCSVEAILMEHQAYEVAGRLMQLAIILGGVQPDLEEHEL